MRLISCRNIQMAYAGNIVLDDVNFDVEQGDYLCIIGENGSGKSTLIKIILGLLRPAGGQIVFNGLKQNQIGYMPQQTMVQKDFPASVYEVVLSGCLNGCSLFPFYSPKNKERADESLRYLEIDAIKKKSYRELSGGQQQRVLLARALCATKKLLLLDEPVAGLDPLMTLELYALIGKLNKEQGITVIMVSHDIKSAVQYGNKILHLDGAAKFFGSTEDYLATDICRRMMGCVNA